MKNYILILFVSCTALLFLSACSSCKPVLYPNDHYNKVGPEQAKKDIATAIEKAKKCGLDDSSDSDQDLAKSASKTAVGTSVNAASSAATGNVGTGTVISAGGSGMSFLIDWMFTKKAPKPLFKKHVELTLKQQGYQVLGWK